MADETLYARPDVYGQVFPLDDEEVGFWQGVAGGRGGVLLDVGAGPSALGHLLGPQLAVAVDVSRELLLGGSGAGRLQGDALALPLGDRCADTMISRLFGVAYAVAADPALRLRVLAAEIARVLAPGGVAAVEVPLAVRPRRLQGMEESCEIYGCLSYRFRYLELTAEHPYGAVIESEIAVESETAVWKLETPLFVFTPEGARQWAAEAGLTDVYFYASYDLTTRTQHPPDDALRGLVTARRENSLR